MSDVATLNSLINDVTDLGGSVKNVKVDEDERGLILRVLRTDGPFDITMPEHLHLDPAAIDYERACVAEDADLPEPVHSFQNAYIAALFHDDDRAALADIRQAVGPLLEEQGEAFEALGLQGFLQTESDTVSLNRRMLTSVAMGRDREHESCRLSVWRGRANHPSTFQRRSAVPTPSMALRPTLSSSTPAASMHSGH